MQIQTLNANIGGAITAPLAPTVASANESPGTPLPKVVFEAILAELANPKQESTQSFVRPAPSTGGFGKVYAAEPVGEIEHPIDSNLVESLPLQSLASTDLSAASTNLTNALMFSLNSPSGVPLKNSPELLDSSVDQSQPSADTEAGLQAATNLAGPANRSALNNIGISTTPVNSAWVHQPSYLPKQSDLTPQRIDLAAKRSNFTRSVQAPNHTEPTPTIPNPINGLVPNEARFVGTSPPLNPSIPENAGNGKLLIQNSLSADLNNAIMDSSQSDVNSVNPSPRGPSIPPIPLLRPNQPTPTLVQNPTRVQNPTLAQNPTSLPSSLGKAQVDESTISPTDSNELHSNRPTAARPTSEQFSTPTSSPALPSLKQPSTPSPSGEAVTSQIDHVSIAENPVSTSEIASFVPIRQRPTNGPETPSSESVDLPNESRAQAGPQSGTIIDSGLPGQAPARPRQTTFDNILPPAINSESSGPGDRSFGTTVETTNVVLPKTLNTEETTQRLFPEELNVTDVQVTAENRPTAESAGSTVPVGNSSSVEPNLENSLSPTTSITEPGVDRAHVVDVHSSLEVKPNSETIVRDYRMPQVAEKTISEVVSEIVAQRNIESQRGNEVTRIRIEIDPPELGEISIEISRHPHQTVATVVVANEHAQQQLSGNIQQLQTSLESMGVEFKQVDIQQHATEQDPFDPAQRDSNFQNETPDRSQRDSSNPTERNQENLNDGSSENTTNDVSIRSVHVVDVLI